MNTEEETTLVNLMLADGYIIDEVVRFVLKLVSDKVSDKVRVEREACAKIADAVENANAVPLDQDERFYDGKWYAANDIASAIRSRT